MVWQVSSVFGRKPIADLDFLVAKAKELTREIAAAEAHLASLRTAFRSVETIADDAGLKADLAAALAPPPELPPIPVTRVKVVKPFKTIFRGGRHGAEEWSAGAGAIIDLPTTLLSTLRGRVEPAPPGAELRGIPLEPWMSTDD